MKKSIENIILNKPIEGEPTMKSNKGFIILS